MLEDDEDTVESLEEWKDEDWEHPTVEVGSLSEDLLKFDEELKRQIEEDKAWLEEEEKADQLLRRDIEQLQMVEEKNKELWDKMNCPEPVLPPEVQERIGELESKVKNLEEQLEEKNNKLQESYESSAEILAKLNDTTKRVIENDKTFKESFEKVRNEYGELEAVLRGKLDSYQKLNKDLELRLNEKEAEIQEMKETSSEVDQLKRKLDEMETKLHENSTSLENVQKQNTKLKAQFKIIKTERDKLKKDQEQNVNTDDLKLKISQLEEEITKLNKEKQNEENIELLKNRITLLEEEKGNLQLQLVDLDELKDSLEEMNRKLHDTVRSYEETRKIAQDVEERNKELTSNLVEARTTIEQQEETISLVKVTLDALTQEKITAVMRCVEIEESLQSRERELANLRESLAAFEENAAVQADRELMSDYNMSNGLQMKLTEAQEELIRLREQNVTLGQLLDDVQSRNNELEKQVAEATSVIDRLKKEELASGVVSLDQHHESSDAEVRFKKLAAKYKIKAKQCQNLEGTLAELKEQIQTYEKEIFRLTEQSATPEVETNQYDIATVKEKLSKCINQLRSVSKESLYTVMDANDLEYLFKSLENWESSNPELLSNKQLDDELKVIIKQKDDLISVLENDKLKLEESIKTTETELDMLRTLYEKECAKNDDFLSDLKNLECEVTRFKELAEIHGKCESTLQDRENYIELLEQDVVGMKQRMLDLESTMDGRQRELRDRTEQLMGKLEEAELMTQNFHMYREQIEKTNRELKENETYLKDKVVNLQVELESSEETCELVKKSNLSLGRDKEVMEKQMEEMTKELENLREIKDAYNNTLDKIEFLNEELKEAMEGFEKKTELLATLENEREKLIRKVSDLEEAFNEMEKKLFESSNEIGRLKSENQALSRSLDLEQREFYENKISEFERALKEVENKLAETSKVEESVQKAEMAVDLFGDTSKDDEGWGWSGDVGPLDLGYANQKYLAIEAESVNLKEELTALKIKNQKLMKKVKDMKMEHEVLSKSQSVAVGFSDLDYALQEELRQEIDKAQGKVKELQNQVASLKAEKENLTSRVDTLTSANYQLVDMKERQDIEVQMWQKRSNELQAQIQVLQRSTEVPIEESSESLNDKLTALADENDELKNLLCGKKEELERAFLREQDLEEELNELKMTLEKKTLELESLHAETKSAFKIQELQLELTSKTNDYNTLMSLNQELESQLQSLGNCVEQQKNTSEEVVLRLKQQIDDLEAQIDQQNTIKSHDQNMLIQENEELKSNLDEKTVEIELLTLKCQELENKPQADPSLTEELTRLKIQLDERDEALSGESLKYTNLRSEYDELKNRERELADSLIKKDKELQNLQTKSASTPSMSAFFDTQHQSADPFSELSLSSPPLDNEEKINLDRLTKENAELKEALETVQLNFQQLQEHSNKLVKEMDALREETSSILAAKEEELRALNNKLNDMKTKDQTIDEKLNYLIQENETLKSDIQGFQIYQEMNLKEFNSQIEKYNKINVEKDTEINQLKEILQNNREEIKMLKTELENYKIQIESINNDIAERTMLVQELEVKLAGRLHESSDDTERSNLALEELQKERTRLELELEEKLSQVDHYEKLVESLRQTPSAPTHSQDDVSRYLETIKDKDGEINRLTKALIDTQEKLLLAEQGKMYPDVRNLQLKYDQALYTLHERDVRCEELTQEVIQLLEERDVLQLRLSQAIRAYDALKKSAGLTSNEDSAASLTDDPPSPVHARSEKVEYRKDPVIQFEREARHNQMMQLYSSETSSPQQTEETSGPLDYGIFNWFFGGSNTSSQHQAESNNS